VCAAVAGLLVGSILLAVTIGPAQLSVTTAWRVIVDHLGGPDSGASRNQDHIVWQLRLPRVLVGASVGAGLGIVGAILQTLTRNPLADPYLLGISAGASFGAVLVIVVGIGAGVHALATGAFVGAVSSFALVLLFGRRGRRLVPTRMILAGVAVGELCAAATTLLIIWVGDPHATQSITYWLAGSLAAARWPAVGLGIGAVLGIAGLALWHGRALNAMAFGEDAAAALGIDVDRLRWILLVATALLTGCLVAISGAIGFVGLILPHAVRYVVGPDHHKVLPLVGLVGAVFLIWVDVLARTLFAPREIPVGVMTAFVGVPAFVVLMRRRHVSEAR
jgi:iron complex transport system permease protein